MSGRNSLILKKSILNILKDGQPHTYAELEKKVNSNWKTIRSHCKELELFDCIMTEKKQSHARNNKPYFEITIKKKGLEALEKLSKH